MSNTQFRLAARTDAAGKYNAEAPLEGNEDNYFIDNDLTNEIQSQFTADNVVDLSEKGCLMVVADGMGGMNAGEVASEIAIKTVTEYFNPERLKDKSFRDSRARIKYLEDVVVAADTAIKNDARANKDHEGMGSTIILAWLCDNKICLTWCGDSRAYLYRPSRGFWQVSKDHSYVQGLVDEGKITMDEAFDHPYGNIITRSLGDPEKKAKPDSVLFDVYEGDVFMLCSDGLSGVLRDHKTYVNGQRVDSDNLEDIISANLNSLAQCRDALFDAAQRNEWYDNVTVILCEITKGNPQPSDSPQLVRPDVAQAVSTTQTPNPIQQKGGGNTGKRKQKRMLLVVIAAAVLLLGVICFVVLKTTNNNQLSEDDKAYELCKKNNNVDDYRYYKRHYSNGAHIDSVEAWLEGWVQDSALKAAIKIEESRNVDNDNKEKNTAIEVPAKDKESSTKTVIQKTDVTAPVSDILPSGNDTLIKKTGIQLDSIKIKPGDDSKIKMESSVNKAEGLTPDIPKDEEDAFNRVNGKQTPTLEDYLFYLENYYQPIYKDHRDAVVNKFISFYNRKLNSCSTYEECQQFLNEHESIMVRAKMSGGLADESFRKRAQSKLNQLSPKRSAHNVSTNNTGTQKASRVQPKPMK